MATGNGQSSIRGHRRAMRQRDLTRWPRYEAAVLGFHEYWYPLTWSRSVGRRPRTYQLLGDPIMVRRERGKFLTFLEREIQMISLPSAHEVIRGGRAQEPHVALVHI